MQDVKTTSKELSVALLISDIKVAKELSQIFRKVGVIPHVYESLTTFWTGTLNDRPDLSVVDVRLMNDGELLFKNHPSVIDRTLNVSFFWNDDCEPLLFSTYEIFNYGLIHEKGSYLGQIKSLLKRFNEHQELIFEKEKSSNEANSLESRIGKVIQANEDVKQKEFYNSFLKSLMTKIEAQKNQSDFVEAIKNVFSTVKEFQNYSILELTKSGQKLYSPKVEEFKFQEIPSLWLGRTCEKGIEFFAQNMASQVALELLGGNLMSLLIKGKKEHPEKMLFIKVESEEMLESFEWETFERFLSGIYCYFEYRNQSTNNSDEQVWQPWELFQFLEQVGLGAIPGESMKGGFEEWAMIDLDFSSLDKTIKEKDGIRFYFKNFFRDFVNGLKNQKNLDFYVSCFGIKNMTLLMSRDNLEEDFFTLKTYVKKFPFWKYFEETDIALVRSLAPTVKMVPLSINGLNTYHETGDYLQVPVKNPELSKKKNTRPVIINGPTHSM
tara:strand:- start:54783 stop:56267 length:1485 start_codon:yes stop_codon:yes gene_type:complete